MPKNNRRETLADIKDAGYKLAVERADTERTGEVSDDAVAASLALAGVAGWTMYKHGRSSRSLAVRAYQQAADQADAHNPRTLADTVDEFQAQAE